MNLDELRSVQNKERSKDSLQHLRESFYADVAGYIQDLRQERERAADRAENPFDSDEVNRLTDEIQTAEDVVEAIYERRVGKIVKRASLAAAGMPADDEGLTSEEQDLFADLVARIEENKSFVLDVLAGDQTGGSPATDQTDAPTSTGAADDGDAGTPDPAAPSESGGAGTDSMPAADAMGGQESESESDDRPSSEAAAVAGGPSGTSGAPDPAPADDGDDADESQTDGGLDERTTVRITSDVGEILGVDNRSYDLETEDVVTLPAENAAPLLDRNAAEKVE
jgi:DNA replication factor GINS